MKQYLVEMVQVSMIPYLEMIERATNKDDRVEEEEVQQTTSRPWSDDVWSDIQNFDESCYGHGWKVSGVAKEEMKRVTTKIYKDRAISMVRNGILWDEPTFIRYMDGSNIKKSWLQFFKMKIFNWLSNLT